MKASIRALILMYFLSAVAGADTATGVVPTRTIGEVCRNALSSVWSLKRSFNVAYAGAGIKKDAAIKRLVRRYPQLAPHAAYLRSFDRVLVSRSLVQFQRETHDVAYLGASNTIKVDVLGIHLALQLDDEDGANAYDVARAWRAVATEREIKGEPRVFTRDGHPSGFRVALPPGTPLAPVVEAWAEVDRLFPAPGRRPAFSGDAGS